MFAVLMLLAVTSSPAVAAQSIDQIATRPELRDSIVAGEVYDLDSHRVLYSRNPYTLMEAASTTKLVTEGTSLALLGADFRYTTPVYRTGPLDASGTLHGDVVLVASGDPNLSQRIKPDGTLAFENEDHIYGGSLDTRVVPGDPLAVLRDLAQQVVHAGVKRIDGYVLVDTSLFPDQGPEAGTGTVVSPIAVNDNVVDLTWTAGAKAGDPVQMTVSPQTSYVSFVNKMTTGAPGSEYKLIPNDVPSQAAHTHTVTLTGSVPAGKSIVDAYPVPEPKLFAQAAFTQALSDAGVSVASPTPDASHAPNAAMYTDANRIAQHVSPPLSEDVYVTLKVSHNLHAALMPYMWAVYVAHAKTDFLKAGFARERQLLTNAGLNTSNAVEQDGLGGFAFFTPQFMVQYLAWVAKQPWYASFHRALPILGVDGTLFNIQNGSPADGKVFAKTGTWGSGDVLNDRGLVTKGLAGFTTTRSGHHVAFAFWINRLPGKQSIYVNQDTAHHAGELLGAMAAATYLNY